MIHYTFGFQSATPERLESMTHCVLYLHTVWISQNVYEMEAYFQEKITEDLIFYENKADRVIGIAIIFTNANLSGVLAVAPKDLFPVL